MKAAADGEPRKVKFVGRTTPPIDSLHPRDHKLLNSIQDPVLGAAELHPDGNCGSRGHGVLTFRSVGRHPPRLPPRMRRLLCGGARRTFSASQPTPPYGEPREAATGSCCSTSAVEAREGLQAQRRPSAAGVAPRGPPPAPTAILARREQGRARQSGGRWPLLCFELGPLVGWRATPSL